MSDVLQFLLLVLILALLYTQQRGKNFLPGKGNAKVILDTCALIDGRVIELARSGFVPGTLVIPEFIIHELQLLADGADAHKRSRARYGLDVVHDLQELDDVQVVIDRTSIPHVHAVDNKLVALAQKLKAPLYTTDYNLGKVAEIDGVKVLNVNELAQHLRPTALPGEQRTVKIIQKGSNAKQGAGYLDDGTLIVVENAAKFVGKTVKVDITKTHQTSSGKMLFGEIVVAQPARSKNAGSSSATRRSSSARSLASRLKR